MRYYRSACLLLIAFLFIVPAIRAQHISEAMKFSSPVDPRDSNSISIGYSNLFYFQDYEYFNQIQTGYTSFGTWHYPRLRIQPNASLRFEAGVLLQKEFGDRGIERAWPMFSLEYGIRQFRMLFGVLEGSLSHQLDEPLMSNEQLLKRPLEEGFQLLWKSKRIKADLWLDWSLRQKPQSDFPEELTGGLNLSIGLSDPEKPWSFSLPVQILLPHKGGQLDTNQAEVSTVFNSSTGVVAEWNNPDRNEFLGQIRSSLKLMLYDLSHDKQAYPYAGGHGWMANVFLRSKWGLGCLVNYWKGQQFIAPLGASLYQSVSSIPGVNYTEQQRELLFLSLLYEKELFPGFFTDLRYNPYYNIKDGILEHSFQVLFSYRNNFRIGNLKRSNAIGLKH